MTYSVDDTQPGAPAPASTPAPAPFQGDPINLRPTIHMEDEGGRPRGGCLMPGLIAVFMLGVAVAIVALSGLAGWTSGSREANANATATKNFRINEQWQFIPEDIESGNTARLDPRVRWLAAITPGVPGVPELIMTATALYLNTLPTATAAATATPEAVVTAQPTEEELTLSTGADGGYDLAQVLSQAEAAAASSQWQDAIDLLDVVIGADASFETQRVNTLMSQALNSYARELYNGNRPAEANVVVARAREFGPLAEGIAYENMAAELFLTARAAIGTGSPLAIADLQAVLDLGPGRYYEQAQTLLYDMYVAQGDAYVGQGNSCSAVGSYQRATQVFSSGVANGKLAAAQNACANTPPTTDPNIIIPSDQTVAPVGQVSP